jgi:hypothetical protein
VSKITDGRFAPGYFDNEFQLQEGYTHILGFNEPGKESRQILYIADDQIIVIQQ